MTSMVNQQLKDCNWFKAQQARLKLSNSQMAKALGTTVSYVEKMRAGTRKIGKRIEIIIGLLMERK